MPRSFLVKKARYANDFASSRPVFYKQPSSPTEGTTAPNTATVHSFTSSIHHHHHHSQSGNRFSSSSYGEYSTHTLTQPDSFSTQKVQILVVCDGQQLPFEHRSVLRVCVCADGDNTPRHHCKWSCLKQKESTHTKKGRILSQQSACNRIIIIIGMAKADWSFVSVFWPQCLGDNTCCC